MCRGKDGQRLLHAFDPTGDVLFYVVSDVSILNSINFVYVIAVIYVVDGVKETATVGVSKYVIGFRKYIFSRLYSTVLTKKRNKKVHNEIHTEIHKAPTKDDT